MCVRWIVFRGVFAALLLFALGIGGASAGILVVAPHPDDDVITSAGVISRAIGQGQAVTVVFVTNGDADGISEGLLRQDEAVAAETNYLGTAEPDLIFLGYPDGYLQEIFNDFPASTDSFITPLGQSETYGDRGLGQSDYHRYRFGAPALYNRSNIITDLQDIIATYRPDHIYTVSEFDKHPDHATTYQLLKLAVLGVHGVDSTYSPVVHKTIVWADSLDNPRVWPAPLDPTVNHVEVPGLSQTTLTWQGRESLEVPVAMQSLNFSENPKYLAVDSHASQGGVTGFIGSFIHKDEIFWPEVLTDTDQPPIANAGTDQTVNDGTVVQLNGSNSLDPEGEPLAYAWSQTTGPAVALSNPTAPTPSFTAQAAASNTVVGFQLVVNDGTSASAPDAVNVTVQATQTASNIAALAAVTASSENVSTDQQAVKAVDGVVDGWPGDYTREWATLGETTGAFLTLAWSSAYTIDHVVLYDRPNGVEQITSAMLSFSDGSTLAIGELNNDGSATTINFTPRTVTALTLTVTGATGVNIGLAEIEVFGVPAGGGNQPPTVSTACVSTPLNTPISGTVTATDPEGQNVTYGLVSQGAKGTVNLDIAGNYVYTPIDPTFRGADRFTFSATDASGSQAIGSVWVFIDGKARIMPLGDSITAGITSGNNPPSATRTGYRLDLFNDLTTASAGKYGINFVGSQSDGAGAGLSDPDHEGHPGWCDDNNPACTGFDTIAGNVNSFLNANPADIVLLHIGTNAFDTSNAGVDSILTNISTWAETHYPVDVYVARIIPSVDGSLDVQTFNDSVAAIATDRPGVTVSVVDQQSELRLPSSPNLADPSLMGNNLHPNASGYSKMANRWKLDMEQTGALPDCQ